MTMSLQAQWSLDQTVGSVLSFAQGIYQAATNDNVGPLAIQASENFGNTIPMCEETCWKIENLVTKINEPAAIHFLRASVGFTTRDCATQLSKSQAGVRFLGLAAALVTSLGPFESSNALEQLLNSSASDRRFLPTARQLMLMLEALEPRLEYSGFADSLAGWVIFLCHSSRITQGYRDSWEVSTSFPNPKGLDSLVNAFRQIASIGDSDVIKVSIKATICTPWVVAFTKWCLGAPPSIFLDDGTIILEQPGTKVEVLASLDSENCPGIEVSIYRALGAPSDLVASLSGGGSWTGMVSIETYGQWMLHKFEFTEGSANQALMQALPYAIKKIIESLRLSKYREFDFSIPLRDWRHQSLQDGPVIDEESMGLRLSPFGNEAAIVNMIRRLLGVSGSFQLWSLDDLIEDLPLVKLHINTIKGQCLCSVCNPAAGKNFRSCEKTKLVHHLAFVCADILALSLFQGPDSPLVQLQHYRDGSYPFKKAIYSILANESVGNIRVSDILHYTLDLVGHKVADDVKESKWVMSCFKGQVIYPHLYESLHYDKQGYLTLALSSGLLRYRGEVYTRVIGEKICSPGARSHPVIGVRGEVTRPCNLFPDFKVVWHVEQFNDFLNVSLGLQSVQRDLSSTRYSVNWILENLASAIMLEACWHSPEAALEEPDEFCAYTGPTVITPYSDLENRIQVVGIVAVEGSDELRLFSLSGGGVIMPIVLRKDACLSCCLDACRRTKYPVIIL
ncbi:hypothetical protein V8E51_006089 [Hyaloscypha variabilis]